MLRVDLVTPDSVGGRKYIFSFETAVDRDLWADCLWCVVLYPSPWLRSTNIEMYAFAQFRAHEQVSDFVREVVLVGPHAAPFTCAGPAEQRRVTPEGLDAGAQERLDPEFCTPATAPTNWRGLEPHPEPDGEPELEAASLEGAWGG